MTALPPGSTAPTPLQTLAWFTRPVSWLERLHRRHGDVFTVKVAPTEGPWVMLAHPDAIKEVFTGNPDDLRAGEGNEILRPLLGARSVLLLDGREHLAQRRLLLPQFHGERMQRYEALVREITEREVGSWPRGAAFPVAPRMQGLTLEVILRAVFGLREGGRLDAVRAALTDLLDFAARPTSFLAVSILGDRVYFGPFKRALDRVDALLYEEIRERRDVADLAEREDILSLLLQATHEDGSPMADVELRDELMTLLVAGHETTATALSWALERLLRHPEALERLRSGDREYLQAVCLETLRLRPVIPLVLRKLQRPMTIAGVDLPAGIKVAPSILLVHRRADVYPEPHAFRPERFLGTSPGTYTWIPFGGGVRRCLGAQFALMEMRVALETIVGSASLRPPVPDGETTGRRTITLAPSRGGEVVAV